MSPRNPLYRLIDHEADPQSRPGSDHYFCTCCLSVPIFKTKQLSISATVGLAEWIIDDIHVLYHINIKMNVVLAIYVIGKACFVSALHFYFQLHAESHLFHTFPLILFLN